MTKKLYFICIFPFFTPFDALSSCKNRRYKYKYDYDKLTPTLVSTNSLQCGGQEPACIYGTVLNVSPNTTWFLDDIRPPLGFKARATFPICAS